MAVLLKFKNHRGRGMCKTARWKRPSAREKTHTQGLANFRLEPLKEVGGMIYHKRVSHNRMT